MVKNEADIIEHTVRHLVGQGVDHVLVADNLSTDATADVLASLSAELPIHIAKDSDPAYYQALKMGLLADAARRAGADWIVPFDADEFWFSESGKLGEKLRASRDDIFIAQMHNLFPLGSASRVGGGGWRLQVNPHDSVKVAFRSHPDAVLQMGNHSVLRPGVITTGLRIVHVPWRSERQFRQKVLVGAESLAATNLGQEVGGHWRQMAAMNDQIAAQQWAKILEGERVEGIHWSPSGPSVEVSIWDWGDWDPAGALRGGREKR